jgi:hypothetical protein
VTDEAAQTRAELESLAHRFEALIRERLRGLAPLEWVDEIHEDELIGISAFVRPARAHSGGVTVTVYQGAELGVAIGPSEFRYHVHKPVGLEKAAGDAVVAINGGARVEVYRRWWRTSTRTIVPAYGLPIATSVWNQEFPGYPLGTHFAQPAMMTETGASGAAITHAAGDVAIGTATAGEQVGARVSIAFDGGYWIRWEGPDEQQYRDTWHDASEMQGVFHEFDREVSWDWIDPEFLAWLESGV